MSTRRQFLVGGATAAATTTVDISSDLAPILVRLAVAEAAIKSPQSPAPKLKSYSGTLTVSGDGQTVQDFDITGLVQADGCKGLKFKNVRVRFPAGAPDNAGMVLRNCPGAILDHVRFLDLIPLGNRKGEGNGLVARLSPDMRLGAVHFIGFTTQIWANGSPRMWGSHLKHESLNGVDGGSRQAGNSFGTAYSLQDSDGCTFNHGSIVSDFDRAITGDIINGYGSSNVLFEDYLIAGCNNVISNPITIQMNNQLGKPVSGWVLRDIDAINYCNVGVQLGWLGVSNTTCERVRVGIWRRATRDPAKWGVRTPDGIAFWSHPSSTGHSLLDCLVMAPFGAQVSGHLPASGIKLGVFAPKSPIVLTGMPGD